MLSVRVQCNDLEPSPITSSSSSSFFSIWNRFRSCPVAAGITNFDIRVGAIKAKIKTAVLIDAGG